MVNLGWIKRRTRHLGLSFGCVSRAVRRSMDPRAQNAAGVQPVNVRAERATKLSEVITISGEEVVVRDGLEPPTLSL